MNPDQLRSTNEALEFPRHFSNQQTGGGNGHPGFVANVIGNRLGTIEGNTNDGGSREGIGVFRRTGRTIDSINRGFIGFGT